VQGSSFIDDRFPPARVKFTLRRVRYRLPGNFSGTPGSPGVHLHFSIVQDDGQENFNELAIGNTQDPSLYLGISLNAAHNNGIAMCGASKNAIADK
jgi:hypothetical protein